MPAAHVPQIRATVLTIQTTLQPENKTITHRIVIANDRARSMNELDRWRLLDVRQNTVTFVDDVAKAYRMEPLAALEQKRRDADAAHLPDPLAPVEFTTTGAKRTLQGVEAAQSIVRSGAYQRELWIAQHPSIPPNLYAMLYASDEDASPFAPMMKSVDEALMAMRGFPLAEHAELPYGKARMVLDRAVIRIEQKNVPQSWFEIPAKYKNVTAPAAGRPPAS